MKTSLVLLSLLTATSASAATINSGKYNAAKRSIDLSVTYGGGCEEHYFSLQMEGCRESFPVQCDATLIESGKPDMCEALITRDISITLQEAGLTDSYYSGASIAISGDNASKVVIRLPR